MTKTNITILDMQPIDPPVGGGRLRLLGLYSGFHDEIEATYVGSYDWRGPGYREHMLASNLKEINVPLSEEHFKAHDDLSMQLGKGCIDSYFSVHGELSKELVNRAREESVRSDVVVFSHPWLFPLVAPVLDPEKQLVVYDSQNCEGLLRDKLLYDGSRVSDMVCREVVRNEYEICHAADLILVCSQEDKNSYVSLYSVDPDKIIIVPNGVFTNQLCPLEDELKRKALRKKLKITKPAVCFIGSGYDPNVEAARLIIETADRLPQYQFVILGGVGGMLQDVDLNVHPNVIITGFLEEQEKIDYLHACDIAINPMLSGSGTNIKMFDFMAAGLPIITTDIGARGIENTNGRVYMLCERNGTSLGESVEKLLNDHEKMCTLRRYGRREAEERYSWEKTSFQLGHTLVKEYNAKKNATEKVLMVSTYPPEKCGIGTYAQQQVKYLRSNGARVDVMAIKGNGKYQVKFDSAEQVKKLKEFKNLYDRIIIQYHASFFYEGADVSARIRIHKAFTEVFKDNPNIEVVCHEISFPADTNGRRFHSELNAKIEKWKAAPKVIFHTEIEKGRYCESTGISPDSDRIKMVAPNQYYTKARDITKEQAREELGIAQDKEVFLCIGFIQPHKAFDKVAEAFSKMENKGNKEFYMVGSLRLVYSDTLNYLGLLQNYADTNENIFLYDEFVSDARFDTWIIAADYVVVPYQEIWSSGVLGRAKLFEKKCVVRNVGGLSEQMSEGDVLFNEYEELAPILERL